MPKVKNALSVNDTIKTPNRKFIRAKENHRAVIYPKVRLVEHGPDNPISCDYAKELLGWEKESEDNPIGENYLFIAPDGKKVRCTNNDKNRPFSLGWALRIAQDILNKVFKYNLESIIIGETGRILSGQHRLIALILACELWENEQMGKLREAWPEQPYLCSVIAFGGDESPEVTRTLDNVRPRSLADVLFADTAVFGKITKEDRKNLCRMTDRAVRVLWSRTGMGASAFSSRRTNAESLGFIDRHPTLLTCIKTMYDLYSRFDYKKFNKLISAGDSAAAFMIMAQSSCDGEKYKNQAKIGNASDKMLKWDNWDKAYLFWHRLTDTTDDSFEPVREMLGDLAISGSTNERLVVLRKAWSLFLEDKKIKKSLIEPDYKTDEFLRKSLDDQHTFGGFDMGSAKRGRPSKDDPDDVEPNKKEANNIEQRKLDIRRKQLEKKKGSRLTVEELEEAGLPITDEDREFSEYEVIEEENDGMSYNEELDEENE